jgi:hypothetical protein
MSREWRRPPSPANRTTTAEMHHADTRLLHICAPPSPTGPRLAPSYSPHSAALFICMLLGTAVHVYHSIPTCADYPFGANESQGLLSLVEAHAVMESDGHEPQGEPEQVDDWEKAGSRRGYGSVAQRQIRADEKV